MVKSVNGFLKELNVSLIILLEKVISFFLSGAKLLNIRFRRSDSIGKERRFVSKCCMSQALLPSTKAHSTENSAVTAVLVSSLSNVQVSTINFQCTFNIQQEQFVKPVAWLVGGSLSARHSI